MFQKQFISRRAFHGLMMGGAAMALPNLAHASTDPVDDLKAFFKGGVVGKGQYISTVDQKPPRGMVMKMTGSVDQDLFVLRQDVEFSDGAKDSNVWRFRREGELKYIGERTKVDGEVPVEINGNKIRLEYIAPVPTDDAKWMTVRFTDTLELVDHKRIRVATQVSYFGITVGHGELIFQR